MRKLLILLLLINLAACTSVREKNKNLAELKLQLGTAYFEQGNYPIALKELLDAEKLDSSNPIIQNNLGLTYFMREKYDLAIKSLKNAIDLRPTYSDARNNLARVYIEKGEYINAEKELNIVINDLTYTQITKAYINMGLSKFNQSKYREAVKYFELAIKSQNDNCVAYSYLGRSYFEQNDYEMAINYLDKGIGFCQKLLYDEPHYFSALAYYRIGNKEKSLARFEEIISLYPNGVYREKAKGMIEILKKGIK